jgi:hypothetical protein
LDPQGRLFFNLKNSSFVATAKRKTRNYFRPLGLKDPRLPPAGGRFPPGRGFPAPDFPEPKLLPDLPNGFEPDVLLTRPKAPGSEDFLPRNGALGRAPCGRAGFEPKSERPAADGR